MPQLVMNQPWTSWVLCNLLPTLSGRWAHRWWKTEVNWNI